MNCSFCARAGAWSAVVATRAANAALRRFRFIGSSLEPSQGMAKPALAMFQSGPTDQHACELSHFILARFAARRAAFSACSARHALLNRLLSEGRQDHGGIPMSVPVRARHLHQPLLRTVSHW